MPSNTKQGVHFRVRPLLGIMMFMPIGFCCGPDARRQRRAPLVLCFENGLDFLEVALLGERGYILELALGNRRLSLDS